MVKWKAMMKFSKFQNKNSTAYAKHKFNSNISYWTMKLFHSGILAFLDRRTFVTLHILHVSATLHAMHTAHTKYPIQWNVVVVFCISFLFSSLHALHHPIYIYISTTNDTEHKFHLTWSHSCERTKVLCVLQNSFTMLCTLQYKVPSIY